MEEKTVDYDQMVEEKIQTILDTLSDCEVDDKVSILIFSIMSIAESIHYPVANLFFKAWQMCNTTDENEAN